MCQDAGNRENKVVKEAYQKLFGKKLTLPYETAKAMVSYHLQLNGYKKAGLPIPKRVAQNYAAMQEANQLTAEQASALEKEGELDMVTIKKSVVKKAGIRLPAEKKEPKKTIDDVWVEVLVATAGKKLTDKAIATKMCEAAMKLTGKKHTYNEAAVAGHRSGYNCGRFACQNGKKPLVRLEKYEPEVSKK